MLAAMSAKQAVGQAGGNSFAWLGCWPSCGIVVGNHVGFDLWVRSGIAQLLLALMSVLTSAKALWVNLLISMPTTPVVVAWDHLLASIMSVLTSAIEGLT